MEYYKAISSLVANIPISYQKLAVNNIKPMSNFLACLDKLAKTDYEKLFSLIH